MKMIIKETFLLKTHFVSFALFDKSICSPKDNMLTN